MLSIIVAIMVGLVSLGALSAEPADRLDPGSVREQQAPGMGFGGGDVGPAPFGGGDVGPAPFGGGDVGPAPFRR